MLDSIASRSAATARFLATDPARQVRTGTTPHEHSGSGSPNSTPRRVWDAAEPPCSQRARAGVTTAPMTPART